MAGYNGDVNAIAIYEALLDGEDIVIPDIDFNDSQYNLPANESMYDGLVKLTVYDITKNATDDDGAYDGIAGAFKRTLVEEYEKGRITGADYVKAFIALQESAMANAIQFLVSRDQVYWQSAQAQAQAITARVQLQTAKVQYASLKLEAFIAKANYCLNKLKLATEDVTFAQGKFQVDSLLPAQLVAIKEQAEASRAQTMNTRSDGTTVITGILGKQKDLYSQQITSYQRDAEVKAAKIFTDAWITMKTIDEGLTPPPGFANASVDEVLTVIKTNNNLDPTP